MIIPQIGQMTIHEEAALKRDEQWRNEVVEHFAESFAHHFNDTAAKEDGLQLRATLTEADPLFDELTSRATRSATRAPGTPCHQMRRRRGCRGGKRRRSWKSLEPQLKKHRCHQFEPLRRSPRTTSTTTYEFITWNIIFSEMKWHAKLNSHRDEIVGKLAEHAR